MPPFGANVNSANVAGGIPPAPLQEMEPEAQSPVSQENLEELSMKQRVRAQILPVHGAGTCRVMEVPEANSNPVEESWGCPLPLVNVAGHMVCGQLFFTTNVAAWTI